MRRLRCARLSILPCLLVFLVPPVEAAKVCCEIIAVDSDQGIVRLRNPINGLVAQFQAGEDSQKFKVGDQFNPDSGTLNRVKLTKRFVLQEPEFPAVVMRATITSVIGARITAQNKETGKGYRFSTLSFGPVLSSLKPGQEIFVDEAGGWAFIRWTSQSQPSVLGETSGRKSQTYAFKLK